ncbi:hypothetical protein WJX72_008534 [[Myrmecia] bisecta]|uniref:Dynein regulatory complex subunit 3 n=1 Tax=[Myrmecia] bisecta TaxID=41462 RepID=A0AAW1QRT9_9CHLO
MPGILLDGPQGEAGPKVITDELTRLCIQVDGDPDNVESKRQKLPYREVEHLAFSFKGLVRVSNLQGLVNLRKLQLDNNALTKIENLDGLVNLRWLDLSFNRIAKIEGLDKLALLEDLSLFSNCIEQMENMEMLTNLMVLSMGRNNITSLHNVMYLRQFKRLRLINLSGNPISNDSDYKSYILSHIKDLTYLDNRRVLAADVQAAMEQHQDEVIELQEKEEQEAAAEKAAAEAAAHQELMQQANLQGVETMLEDMTKNDPEWAKLASIPNLLDSWNDVKDKFTTATDEFKVLMLEQHEKKQAEFAEWLAVATQATSERDQAGRDLVRSFEKVIKQALRSIQDDPGSGEAALKGPRERNEALHEALLALEMETVDILQDLLQQLDRNYSELADASRGFFTTYFATVRDLDNRFFENCATAALTALEKYASDAGDMEGLPDEARQLLADKDSLISTVQAAHDVHSQHLDTLEDRLTSQEVKRANDLVAEKTSWAENRDRARIAEIIAVVDRNRKVMEEALHDDEQYT